eukprot:COSAG05_NODE_1405_length_4969_cov_12.779466_3_plen_157_part_00
MEAVYFGSAKGGLNHGGAGKGPWIMADMENALWGADRVVSNEEPINHAFVTAMVKGDTGAAPGHWAIKGGDAQTGALKTFWDGKRAPGYAPMHKQGAIILGIGGDNSDGAVGTFCAYAAPGTRVCARAPAAVIEEVKFASENTIILPLIPRLLCVL